MVYGVCGLLSAIAGLLVASRMGSGYAAAAMGWDFDAIGATIIGGTSFREGKGGIPKTVLGVLLISILRNGLNVAGVPNMYQFALIGLVVIITIILDVQFRQTVERGFKAK
jgi:ribose transport system permease protein